MSIRDFHAQLVSGNNKNSLFDALRKLRAIADPASLFDTPLDPWPSWYAAQSAALPAEPA
jgi:hypothetical protein